MAHAIVSADHVDRRWLLQHSRVKLTNNGAGWAASIPGFGMGSQHDDPELAIRRLIVANGCTSIRIHSVHLDQEG